MSSLRAGQVEEVKRVFHQTDFDRFAALSGDDNPIHVDPAFSARTKFGRTVAHGMFLYSIVSGVLGTRLPGPGTLQVDQELLFPNPTYTGEEVTVRVEVIQVESDGGLADLATTIFRSDGAPGLEGRTRVRLPGAGAPVEPAQGDHRGSPPQLAGERLKGLEIGQRAEDGIDRRVIHDVVPAVEHGRRVDRGEPDGVDAERIRSAGEMIQVVDQPRDVADPIAVRVGEAPWVHLVDDAVQPPPTGCVRPGGGY